MVGGIIQSTPLKDVDIDKANYQGVMFKYSLNIKFYSQILKPRRGDMIVKLEFRR